jgi:hypothetical protein
MTFSDYIKLADELGFVRDTNWLYYDNEEICLFWFINTDPCDRTGKVNFVNVSGYINDEALTISEAKEKLLNRIKLHKEKQIQQKLEDIANDF